MKKIKSIIFDLGGVLININYKKTIKSFKELGLKNESFYSQKFQHKIFDEFETGCVSPNEFIINLQKFCNGSKKDLISAWNKMILDLPEKRIQLIAKLRKDYDIYLLSNTNEIHIEEIKRICGNKKYEAFEKLFKKVYYSHKINLRKPNVNVFKFVIDDNKLNPKNTLFIDDSEQHINSANKLGISCHLLQGDILNLFPDIVQSIR